MLCALRLWYTIRYHGAQREAVRSALFLCAFRRFGRPHVQCEEQKTKLMDARNIRIGETGMAELIQWLRQTGQPQSLEVITERYLAILRQLIGVEEGS